MLSHIFARFVGLVKRKSRDFDVAFNFNEANKLRLDGRLHEAAALYRECLQRDKFNVEVIDALGSCLVDLGQEDEGCQLFELAYSIDDTYIQAVANYAKTLADKKRTTEAIKLLEHVRVCEPRFTHVYVIYAGICFSRGDFERAIYFHLKGWLGDFDSLRKANTYLFSMSYGASERLLASEHQFWAKTARHIKIDGGCESFEMDASVKSAGRSIEGRKIRIGYWSPDLRSHSVRFFFWPLLNGHDRSRYEVFLYHDFFSRDKFTAAFEGLSDQFHDVYSLNDQQLADLLLSHKLDVLVEMAGHTSANRLMLLNSNRFATLHVSGIGYPPTTGMENIDAKIVDVHIHTGDADKYYAEKPMVLPSSFWCFDPMGVDEVPVVASLPVERNGYITFACVGNIAKITQEVMLLWARVLDAVPLSRILIRSINFEDQAAKEELFIRMQGVGLDMSRIDFKNPEGGAAFFSSYGEIDIILDTYPFNGGTTTCFATYMGVPVITRAGNSLISRMGLSVMSNLNCEQWVAYDDEDYVRKAVEAASDVGFLRRFRLSAREIYKTSPLGNGKLFAADFERACEEMLKEKMEGCSTYLSAISPLPPNEIMRRAYAVLSTGNGDAASRIIEHCLHAYPDYGGAHLFVAQQMAAGAGFADAIAYLADKVPTFDLIDRVAAVISIIRWALLKGDEGLARFWLSEARDLDVDDRFDAMQLDLFSARLGGEEVVEYQDALLESELTPTRLSVLVPCDDEDMFQAIKLRMQSLCLQPVGCEVLYVRCPEGMRARYYKEWVGRSDVDVVIILQRVAEVVSRDFFAEVLKGLNKFDILGVAGARRWAKPSWRDDAFEYKSAGFMTESAEVSGMIEVNLLGEGGACLLGDQAVLDGVVLAIKCSAANGIAFDDELSSVDWLLEEDWTYTAASSGLKLGVHRCLGILVHQGAEQDRRRRYSGLLHLQEKRGFSLFSTERDDGMVLSVPVSSAMCGQYVMSRYCTARPVA